MLRLRAMPFILSEKHLHYVHAAHVHNFVWQWAPYWVQTNALKFSVSVFFLSFFSVFKEVKVKLMFVGAAWKIITINMKLSGDGRCRPTHQKCACSSHMYAILIQTHNGLNAETFITLNVQNKYQIKMYLAIIFAVARICII